MSVYKRKKKDGSYTWWFTRTINSRRYRERIPTARTEKQAKDAEQEFLRQLHDGTYGKAQQGSITLKEFVDTVYLKWAKENKRSWQDDTYRVRALLAAFGDKRLCDITPFSIEAYKRKRLKTPIVYKTKDKRKEPKVKERSPGAVDRELALLSTSFRVALTLP